MKRLPPSRPRKTVLRVVLPDVRSDTAAALLATLRELLGAIDEHYRQQAQRHRPACLCALMPYRQRELFEPSDPPF